MDKILLYITRFLGILMLLLLQNTALSKAKVVRASENELLVFWDKNVCNPSGIKNELNVMSGSNNTNDIASQLLKHINDFSLHKNDSLTKTEMFELISELKNLKYNRAVAYVQFRLAKMFYYNQQATEAIELMLQARATLSEYIEKKSIPHLGSFYAFLGQIYIDNGEPEQAHEFLLKATDASFCSRMDAYYCWGNIGLNYFNLNETGKALDASFKALDIIQQVGDSVEVASMMGNIGTIYLKHGNYPNALKYLEEDYKVSLQFHKWESAVAVLIMKAKAYNLQQQYESAKADLDIADSILNACKCLTNGAKKEYYEQLAKYFAIKGNWPAYANTIDSFIHYSNKMSSVARNNISNFMGTELKVAGKIHETKMQLAESERQRQLLIRNLIIVLSILGLIIVLFFLYNQRQARRNEQKIYVLNLENARNQLNTYLENIRNKNQLLEELQLQLEESRQQNNEDESSLEYRPKDIELMARMEKASLITEQGWLEFTALVEQVHQHFFVKLNMTFENLTPAEVRLVTLIKLKFSVKETAAMLGISADSVRKARYRLKKKLSLEDDNSLDNLIYNI